MNIARRFVLKLLPLLAYRGSSLQGAESDTEWIHIGQGTMSGEVTDSMALLQTRLTLATQLDDESDLPGADGLVCFEWSTRQDFSDLQRTPFQTARHANDFIVRDHDFRYNESDISTDRQPLPQTGIDLFREQLPIAAIGSDKPTYRTHRVSRTLQIWITEGRDYRSDNEMADGPDKSL